MIVGDHEDVRIRDKWLRAQNALRFGSAELGARLSVVQEEKTADQFWLCGRVHVAREPSKHRNALKIRHCRRLRVHDDVVDPLAATVYGGATRRREPRPHRQF